MIWNRSRDKSANEVETLRKELRLLQQQLYGLHDNIQQLISKSQFMAPDFIYSPIEQGFDRDISDRIGALTEELGSDCLLKLREFRRFSEAFMVEAMEELPPDGMN